MTDAESIIRAFAACEPIVIDNDDFYGGPVCGTCGASSSSALNRDVDHEPSCVWRRAHEWVGNATSPAP